MKPSPTGGCRLFCLGNCDPDSAQELHRESIHAEDNEKAMSWWDRVNIQGTVDIRLNGAHLATIDPNTGAIAGLPTSLTFAQFEFINRIYNAITTKP